MLSPEARLLLATATGEGEDAGLRHLLEEGPDRGRLLRLAIRERSLPPLWRRLAPLVEDRWPEEDRATFERIAAGRELFLVLLRRRLVEALGVLEEAGIDVLLLKGAALAHHRYPHFTERPMGDLDLLVAPGEAERAWSLLRRGRWSWDAGAYPEENYGAMHHLPPLTEEGGRGARIEIHRGVLPPGHGYRFGADDLWRGAREVRIEGRRARVPRPVPHALHLCLHFAWAHRLGHGAWRTFRDADVLSRSEGFAWSELGAAARASEAERCCYWTLLLARELGGAPVPGATLERLRPGLPAPVRERLARHYALGLLPTEAGCPSVGLRRTLWRLGVHPSRDERARWPARGEAAAGEAPAPAEATGPGDADDASSGGWRERLKRHLAAREAWLRYLRRVLAGRPQKPGRDASASSVR